MRKFLAVARREYKKVVFSWTFLIGTLLAPTIAIVFSFIPLLLFSIKGDVQRIALADESGKVAARLKANLAPEKIAEKSRKAAGESFKLDQTQQEKLQHDAESFGESFAFEDYSVNGKSAEQVRRELNEKVRNRQIEAYLIVPKNFDAPDAKFEFYSRKAGDIVTNSSLKDALNDAVRAARLEKANISEAKLEEISREVNWSVRGLDETGAAKDDEEEGSAFGAAFVISLLIFITLSIYGQMIMAAVVEEKETRIAEILFSSAKPFELMLGKLVGVGLAGLTQLAIWLGSAGILLAFGAAELAAMGAPSSFPSVTPLSIVCFFVFFLLGYFLYATIFALIGSMVTTTQEGGQFVFLPMIIMLGGFYCFLPIARDPNSTLAFWTSIMPFLSPLTMPARMAIEMPPFWQIALAMTINLATILALVWVAARVYRVGMLMYGKRATLPEVWKWIRQN